MMPFRWMASRMNRIRGLRRLSPFLVVLIVFTLILSTANSFSSFAVPFLEWRKPSLLASDSVMSSTTPQMSWDGTAPDSTILVDEYESGWRSGKLICHEVPH